jgi:hypothetical protein
MMGQAGEGGDGHLNLPSLQAFIKRCSAIQGRRGTKYCFGRHDLTDFDGGDPYSLREDLTSCGVTPFLDRLILSLEERFTENCDALMQHFQIIDPDAWGRGGFNVGLREMELIADYYGAEVVQERGLEIDKDALLHEWTMFKTTPEWVAATSTGPKPDYCHSQGEFWGHFFLKGSGSAEALRDAPSGINYKQLHKVVVAAIVMIVGNAEAERAFSCMNRVCSDFRTKLTSEHLEALMLISFATKMARQGDFPHFSRLHFNWDIVWRRFLMKDRRPGDLRPAKRGRADVTLSKMDRVARRRKRARTLGTQQPSPDPSASEVKEADIEKESSVDQALTDSEADQPMDQVMDFGSINECIQFEHAKLEQEERRSIIGRTFLDEGVTWRVLELGWGLRTKKAYVIYMNDEDLREMFPACQLTFTEVYKKLAVDEEAEDSGSDEDPDEEGMDLNRRVLDYFEYTPLKEAQRCHWVPTLAQIRSTRSRREG